MVRKKGFTLIELLMVMSILAILSTLTLVTLRSVRLDARNARTQSVLNRVRDILQDKLDEITSRSMPFNFQRDFGTSPPAAIASVGVPNWAQRQHVLRRYLTEMVRVEMPQYREQLLTDYPSLSLPAQRRMPSLESRRQVLPAAAPGFASTEIPNYWPGNTYPYGGNPGDGWAGIFSALMQRADSPVRKALVSQIGVSTQFLIDPDPLDNEYWLMENNNGWNGVVVPTVTNTLTPNQLAHGIAESGDLLYLILYNTLDRDGNRGTDFLRPEDLGDTNDNGIPEIVDARGLPIIFSITVQNVAQDGSLIDRNFDGSFDFRDQLLDPRFPGEPQDFLIHLGQISTEEYPPHLQHLRNSDFSILEVNP